MDSLLVGRRASRVSRVTSRLASLLLSSLLVACGGDGPTSPDGDASFASCVGATAYTPTGGWRATCPAAVDMDSAQLRVALREADGTMPTLRALAVARRGWLVAESYHGMHRGDAVDIRSVTKAVVATVVGAAIQNGRIDGTDQLLSDYWPQYLTARDDARKAQLRVEHLLDLTAGFRPNSQGTSDESMAATALTRPLSDAPGTSWWYDELLYHLLPHLVSAADPRGATAVARDDVFGPLGMAQAIERWPLDADGTLWGAAGLRLTTAEMLKIGELYRRDGVWEGRRILPPGWVAAIRDRPADAPADAVYWSRGWRQRLLAGHLAIYAEGYAGQYIIVVPSLELVVVAGADVDAATSRFPDVLSLVEDEIIPAAVNE